ncbi:MAG: aldehyde ferredoxin oxidoreductase, partial [Deltaproteobacteria bacterium]
MYGWMGKILRVNLSSGNISTENLDPKVAEDYIGGRGLGVKYLIDEVDPRVEPLSPDNKLIFAAGPATGTRALGASRYEVVTKAPLTGTIGGANSAGFWGPQLKFAGYDMIVIEGKAEKPVYIMIENEKVEIISAVNVWGKDTRETQKIIRDQTDKDAKIACIGPAGEKLVRFACIINDEGRAAGRGGLGAVMGSKNLKAVAVRGNKKVAVADENSLRELVKRVWAAQKKPGFLTTYGTVGVVEWSNAAGAFPTRNFQTGVFSGAEKIGGEALKNSIFVKRNHCYGCPVGCGRVTKVTDPEFISEGDGPEYEGVYSLGSCCGVDNLAAITKAYHMCNELGLDVMTAGVTIACAMEMFERGIISEKEVGMPANFGDAKVLVELVRKTAYREGFGDMLAEGSYRLAEKYGHPEFSISVKGQELAGYDPRGAQGLGLAYATSTRGADHMRTQFEDIEPLGLLYPDIGVEEETDRFSTEGKAGLVIKMENDKAAIDSMGICAFLSGYK